MEDIIRNLLMTLIVIVACCSSAAYSQTKLARNVASQCISEQMKRSSGSLELLMTLNLPGVASFYYGGASK